MKATNFNLVKYEADEGKVFDWKEPRFREEHDERGNLISKTQEHLYARILFIGELDSIENYIEVEMPKED